MFHLTNSEANALHEQFHDLADEALKDGNPTRAEIMQEAAKIVHEARMAAFDQRAALARRRRQRQLQGAAH